MEKRYSVITVESKVPTDLRKVLGTDLKVTTLWKDLTPLARRDFITWIESAKQEETRKRRVESVPSRLLSGKRRPCCYAIVPMNFYKALSGTSKAKAVWSTLTPDERRDLVAWVEEVKDKEGRGKRVEKACLQLAKGVRRP